MRMPIPVSPSIFSFGSCAEAEAEELGVGAAPELPALDADAAADDDDISPLESQATRRNRRPRCAF